MYAAKSGKMGLRIAFKSEGGHFGTMKMMGGMAKTLEHAKEYWVLQRQSIPGFLAQVTLEAFEKTTVSFKLFPSYVDASTDPTNFMIDRASGRIRW
jgi:hypothetical protein